MRASRVAVMFAGQGVLDQSACPPCAAAGSDRAGNIEGGGIAPVIPEDADRPAALDLRIYSASLAAYRRLTDGGLTPVMLIGHGFGEIAAMVAAGAFSFAEGAEIVAARFAALAGGAARRYGMASLEASPTQVRILLKLLGRLPISLAAENSSRQSVIAGSSSALWAAADLAATLDIPFVLLKTGCAPHHPGANEAAADLRSRLRHIGQRPFQQSVLSTLRQRPYQDSDNLIDCLAEQLAAPIRFADAIAHVVGGSVSLVVECGPLRGLALTLDCDAVTDTDFLRVLRAAAPGDVLRQDGAALDPVREVA